MSAAAEILNVEEVADLLRVGRSTIYEAVSRGDIPHRRVGRRLIFSRAAVMEWVAGKTPANE